MTSGTVGVRSGTCTGGGVACAVTVASPAGVLTLPVTVTVGGAARGFVGAGVLAGGAAGNVVDGARGFVAFGGRAGPLTGGVVLAGGDVPVDGRGV